MDFLWTEIFFRPLLNLLVGLYNTIGLENLGLAIIWLTILTKIVLLPFSFEDEKQREKKIKLNLELGKLQSHFSTNPSVLRDEQKKLFAQYHIRRWPKVFNLIVQGFILLVLYQVFLGGIRLEEIVDSLYPFVSVPTSINTIFLGLDVSHPSFILSFLPAAMLFATIIVDHGGRKTPWSLKDLILLIGFPLATLLVLWYLPAVKAIFIFFSMLFTAILRVLASFLLSIRQQKDQMQKQQDEEKELKNASLPHIKERFN